VRLGSRIAGAHGGRRATTQRPRARDDDGKPYSALHRFTLPGRHFIGHIFVLNRAKPCRITAVKRLIAWLRARNLVTLSVVLAVLFGLSVFVAIADEVGENSTQEIDEHLVRALREPNNPADAIGPPWLEEMARDCTALGGVMWLSLLTTGVVVYLTIAGKRRAALFVALAVLGALGLNILLKESFVRPRPSVVPHLSFVDTSSFPSGHSMLSAAVYLTLGTCLSRIEERRRIKAFFVGAALVLTAFVGVSRVWMGVHYPTDVLAGWTLGLTWALVCWLIAETFLWLDARKAGAQ
jgi:undecaprenyl-diphosphatase